jgi:hypothetical protein
MAESSNNRWWNRELALVGAGGALVTIFMDRDLAHVDQEPVAV